MKDKETKVGYLKCRKFADIFQSMSRRSECDFVAFF